ncbi:hypothetical protein AAF712_007748 [Marasmius tenuissimus]|uniref:Uncharacterized protein n=1 Tax=Marasmius tenuissimus TaxID=585030 RepID=A0ABR2ZU74_9AGAR
MVHVFDTVRLVYYPGIKGSLISQENIHGAIEMLKTDLLALKVPHPPQVNISVVEKGTIEFFWNTKKGGVGYSLYPSLVEFTQKNPQTLDIVLNQRFRNSAKQPELQETLRSLLIKNVEFQSRPAPDTPTQPRRHSQSSFSGHSTRISLQHNPTQKRRSSNLSWTNQESGKASVSDRSVDSMRDLKLQREAQELLDDIGENILKPKIESDSSPKIGTLKPLAAPTHGPTQSNNACDKVQPKLDLQEPRVGPCRNGIPVSAESLLSELAEVRRKIAAEVAKESAICEQLRTRGVTPDLSTDGLLMSARETAQFRQATMQLLEEKKRRKAAEDALKDVQRECREPFVVPALLDAFVALSNASTNVLDGR